MRALDLVGTKSAPRLAKAGWGEVYLAQDTKLDREVALKILPAVAAHRDRMQRFGQQAKLVSGVRVAVMDRFPD
jgi:serine/threonine protein kinase